MRKFLSVVIIAIVTWSLVGEVVFAQQSKARNEEPQTQVVDVTADVVYPHKVNDTLEVMCLVGGFAAQHNGAVITADSAVRYNDKRLECFGRVLINQNTTYAYADRAIYNGETNEAELFAPIVKVVDGDAVLYAYNFRFNTKDNIGYYDGGGVMLNGDDVMESITGYYYSDDKNLIGVGDVELRGTDYEMQSDSIIYNTESESANYFSRTNIWNKKDEYLYADRGDYSKAEDRYSFDLNGYILTAEQEMWSDSMDYFRSREHVFMHSNVQIDDTTHKSLVFADYGEYLKTPGNTTLTGRPVVVSYDVEQGDSLFMRADTIKIFTLNRFEGEEKSIEPQADSTAQPKVEEPKQTEVTNQTETSDREQTEQIKQAEQAEEIDTATPEVATPEVATSDVATLPAPPAVSPERTAKIDSLGGAVRPTTEQAPTIEEPRDVMQDSTEVDSMATDSLTADSLSLDSLAVDSLAVDSLAMAADTLNFWEKILANYNAKRAIRLERKAEEAAARKIVLDSIGRERQKVINANLDEEKYKAEQRDIERRKRAYDKALKRRNRAIAKGKISADDTTRFKLPELGDTVAHFTTTVPEEAADSLAADSLAIDSLSVDSLAMDSIKVDSMYRLVKGYRDVKIYRSDFQSVADSMSFSSIDSIIHLYIEPVLWHDKNQVTSEVMDIYTANQQIDKAIFTGTPFMSSEVDGAYYNQVTGKLMTSLFREGAIYRNDVDGNAQTIYYMQDDKTGDVTGMMVLESGSTTFYIANQTVEGITYRTAPEYVLYPMDMIPADQAPTLKGFTWQAERRPLLEDVMDRTQRPTQRDEKSALPRPEFPINTEFEELRERLVRDREWIDRTDVVDAETEQWLESLGFKSGQPREDK